MKSWFGCVSFVVLLAMVGCVFVIAQRMHQAQIEVQKLNREIAQEQDHLRVLQAEWTYLNNPERLEKLAMTLFNLHPMDSKQYVALSDMPTQADMQKIELAQQGNDTTVEKQQLAAASTPVDEQKVDRALALAASTAPEAQPVTLPTAMNVSLTDDGVE